MSRNPFVLIYYYIYLFLKRLGRSEDGATFRTWCAQLVIAWVQGQAVLCAIVIFRPRAFEAANKYVMAVIIAIPILVLNLKILTNRQREASFRGRSPL